jgi:hypothetical protein
MPVGRILRCETDCPLGDHSLQRAVVFLKRGALGLEANPPRVIDRMVVGDAPEGFVISRTGEIAVAMLLRGNDGPKQSWF